MAGPRTGKRRSTKTLPAGAAEAIQAAEVVSSQALVPTREGRNGGRLRTGNPGNKGGTGRPSNAWRNKLAQLVEDPRVEAQMRRRLKGKEGAQVAQKTYEYIANQAHGKPVQPVQVGGELTNELIVRVVHE